MIKPGGNLLAAIILACTFSISHCYLGKYIGSMSTLAHKVSGEVYVVDNNRIRIRNLTYDGTAPAAFFWIGLKGNHSLLIDEHGLAIPNQDGRLTRLEKFDNADIVLSLPNSIAINDILWLSIWCQQFKIDFGHVYFPSYVEVPAVLNLPSLQSSNTIQSGNITILDSRTIFVPDFVFDGVLKDVFFAVEKRLVKPDEKSDALNKSIEVVARKDGGLSPLTKNESGNVTIVLPPHLQINLLSHLLVYLPSDKRRLASVGIPRDINVPPFLSK